jgi:hypothetical protein
MYEGAARPPSPRPGPAPPRTTRPGGTTRASLSRGTTSTRPPSSSCSSPTRPTPRRRTCDSSSQSTLTSGACAGSSANRAGPSGARAPSCMMCATPTGGPRVGAGLRRPRRHAALDAGRAVLAAAVGRAALRAQHGAALRHLRAPRRPSARAAAQRAQPGRRRRVGPRPAAVRTGRQPNEHLVPHRVRRRRRRAPLPAPPAPPRGLLSAAWGGVLGGGGALRALRQPVDAARRAGGRAGRERLLERRPVQLGAERGGARL